MFHLFLQNNWRDKNRQCHSLSNKKTKPALVSFLMKKKTRKVMRYFNFLNFTPDFTPKPSNPKIFRKPHGWDKPDRLLILNLRINKNLPKLLSAVSQSADQGQPNIRVLLERKRLGTIDCPLPYFSEIVKFSLRQKSSSLILFYVDSMRNF